MGIITAILIIIGLGWLAIEVQYRKRPGNDLELTAGEWKTGIKESDRYLLIGEMELENRTKTLEIMVPELTAEVKLLSDGSLEGINTTVKVIPCQDRKSVV